MTSRNAQSVVGHFPRDGYAKMLLVVLFVSLAAFPALASTTWYVRDGGGNSRQCTGKTDAVYSGTGTGQACAFNNPRYVLGWDNVNPIPGPMAGGDTLTINGDSDINPGQQAQYLIGY